MSEPVDVQVRSPDGQADYDFKAYEESAFPGARMRDLLRRPDIWELLRDRYPDSQYFASNFLSVRSPSEILVAPPTPTWWIGFPIILGV